jgi:hypothetical protein
VRRDGKGSALSEELLIRTRSARLRQQCNQSQIEQQQRSALDSDTKPCAHQPARPRQLPTTPRERDSNRDVPDIQPTVEPEKSVQTCHAIVVPQCQARPRSQSQHDVNGTPRASLNREMSQERRVEPLGAPEHPAAKRGDKTCATPQQQAREMCAFKCQNLISPHAPPSWQQPSWQQPSWQQPPCPPASCRHASYQRAATDGAASSARCSAVSSANCIGSLSSIPGAQITTPSAEEFRAR